MSSTPSRSEAVPWRTTDHVPPLSRDVIDVWRASLSQPAPVLARCRASLSAGESTRAERFASPLLTERFVVGRGILRNLLGGYLGQAAQRVSIVSDGNQKPRLVEAPGAPPIRFNIAHSEDLIVVAVALDRHVGIDVEFIREIEDAEQIARRFFAAEERATLMSLPPRERLEGFYTCWTRKEAYLKALGEGLSVPLTSFAVTVWPTEPAALLRSSTGPDDARRFQFREFTPADQCRGTLAAPGDDWEIRLWDWKPGLAASEVTGSGSEIAGESEAESKQDRR